AAPDSDRTGRARSPSRSRFSAARVLSSSHRFAREKDETRGTRPRGGAVEIAPHRVDQQPRAFEHVRQLLTRVGAHAFTKGLDRAASRHFDVLLDPAGLRVPAAANVVLAPFSLKALLRN